jgi:poly(3-hydroxybutyrate) depolymerase
VNTRTILLAILCSGFVALTAQESTPPRVFTAAQAEAGRVAYENACGKCHAYNVLGRASAEDGLPAVDSLPAFYQEFIRKTGHVPPLAGKVFLGRWGQKTAAELIARFQVTAGDKFFQFQGMNEDTTVNITAYVLQVSGAKAGTQELTRSTSDVVNSLVQ